MGSKKRLQDGFLDLESPDSQELKGMNKKLNLKLQYKRAFKRINKYKANGARQIQHLSPYALSLKPYALY